MSERVQEPAIRSVVLWPDLEQLAEARHFVAGVATDAGFSPERVFDITVACSEAVANAIEHVPVKGQVTVKTLLYCNRLEIQVTGPGEFQAPHRLDGKLAHRGLGLPLMAQFSDHLALYSDPSGGTLVSLTFQRPGAEPAAAGRQVGALFADAGEGARKDADLLFVAAVDRLLSGALASQEVLKRVGQMLGDHMRVDNFVLAEAEQAGDRARVLHAWRDERAAKLLATYSLSELSGPDYWTAMRNGIPYVVGDTAADARTDGPAHSGFGVGAYMVVPFDREGTWKYLVSVDCREARPWTAAEVNLFKEVANRVVARVERAWAEEELRASEEKYRLLAADNERLYRQQLDTAEHLQSVLDRVLSFSGGSLSDDLAVRALALTEPSADRAPRRRRPAPPDLT